jgi:hypothetical protein
MYLENPESLPPSEIIAQEIADNLDSVLDSVKESLVSYVQKKFPYPLI